ncbi:DUF4350 domain-containing protein [Brevundimonas lenta]|uniref:DUF4350 domain-containing protein n=1 Tax=Brevundimonas lenta TaxID=424796 RepID=A0A7W6JGZ5_9CAUL|nr:DUF4350 domain-containing protein [Brevundimonas lenta]MBB4083941.1 hypothetical protein [Brevundimonas lenta]
MRLFALALSLVLVVTAPAVAQQQMVDPDFQPRVERPAYAADGPVVVIDQAHHNFHTVDGQYSPFAALLRADGYQVRGGALKFDAGGLDGVDVLVIANAGAVHPDEAGGPIFTEAETAAVEAWVRNGGRLLLIADHAPFGAAAEPLAARFGVGMGKGYAFILTNAVDLTTTLTYPAGVMPAHPIVTGRTPDERGEAVTAFTGQSLSGPAGATVLLPIAAGAREALNVQVLQQINDRLEAGEAADVVLAELSASALPAQGLAFEYGEGRVVVLGEAGMLSAQLIRFPPESGQADRRFGMNAAPGNARFGLNVMHWLSGLTP